MGVSCLQNSCLLCRTVKLVVASAICCSRLLRVSLLGEFHLLLTCHFFICHIYFIKLCRFSQQTNWCFLGTHTRRRLPAWWCTQFLQVVHKEEDFWKHEELTHNEAADTTAHNTATLYCSLKVWQGHWLPWMRRHDELSVRKSVCIWQRASRMFTGQRWPATSTSTSCTV